MPRLTDTACGQRPLGRQPGAGRQRAPLDRRPATARASWRKSGPVPDGPVAELADDRAGRPRIGPLWQKWPCSSWSTSATIGAWPSSSDTLRAAPGRGARAHRLVGHPRPARRDRAARRALARRRACRRPTPSRWQAIAAATAEVLADDAGRRPPVRGDRRLRPAAVVGGRPLRDGADADDVVITHGAQQALELRGPGAGRPGRRRGPGRPRLRRRAPGLPPRRRPTSSASRATPTASGSTSSPTASPPAPGPRSSTSSPSSTTRPAPRSSPSAATRWPTWPTATAS